MIRRVLRRMRMRIKFLLITIVIMGLFMGISLHRAILFQTDMAMKQVAEASNLLLENTYSAIRFPMSIGDSKTVEEQLRGVKQHTQGVQVYLSDFFHKITYASEEKHLHNRMESYLHSKESRAVLENTMLTGDAPARPLVDTEEDEPLLVTIKPILNEPTCYHCHTDYRNVLGVMVVRQSIKEVLASIRATRNHLILYSVITLAGLVMGINFLFAKLVSRRIGQLEMLTRQVAAGDVTINIHDDNEDSIGKLTNNMNQMVKSIRDRIEYANSLKLAIFDPFFIVDPSLRVTFVNEAVSRLVGMPADEILGKTCEEVFQSNACGQDCPVQKALRTGTGTVGQRMRLKDRQGREIPVMTSASVLRDASGNVLGSYEIIRDLTDEVAAEKKLQGAYQREEEEKKALEENVRNLSEILDQAAHGDFTKRGKATGAHNAMEVMTLRINETLEGMVALISQVKGYIVPVTRGVRKISRENENLSERTQHQAAATEEISSSLEELVANINENLTNTRKADSLAKEAVRVADDGGHLVEKTAQSMVNMSGASKKIVEMMELINEITFQTTLLSVNAAVEAARAGEQGRGFAVVAEEIRNLAKRSAASAKDIEVLVREIMDSASTAHQWVDRVKEYFCKIVQTSTQVSQALEEVRLGSEESSQGIGQINRGILELCEVNEKNTCFAEEIAIEMKNLKEKVGQLKKITEVFVLGERKEGHSEEIAEAEKTSEDAVRDHRKLMPNRHRTRDLRLQLLAQEMDDDWRKKEEEEFKEF